MLGHEFKAWRERVGLTQQQLADRLKVTRTTIQNWENGASAVPEAAAISSEILERQLKQENPNFGPLTLIYSDGPMFVSAYGPRSRVPMMQQEPYLTNAAALARVQLLWGRATFHNPFILDESQSTVWNSVELGRVARDRELNAPTLVNLLRAMAQSLRASCTTYVTTGRGILNPMEAAERENAIKAQADELDRLAKAGLPAILRDPLQIDRVYFSLHALGKMAPEPLVSNVAHALVVLTKEPLPATFAARREGRDFVLDYKGCVITWPEVPMFGGQWTVNVASNSPALLNRLGGNVVINDFVSIEDAVAKAQRHVDEVLQ
jgi:hypothetical protein